MVHRLVGAALDYAPADHVKWDEDAPLMDSSFVVTDGARTFTVTVIEIGRGAQPLLMFLDDMPPRNSDLWVVHHTLGANRGNPSGRDTGGVICFTPGTWIRTPDGARPIEDLRQGDLVQTKDSGAQPIEWVGSRPMTGARLFAMPHMRPIRIRAGALGVERPDESLLVSPEHRMLVKGNAARALFNTSEVLVAAKDLINGRTITVDLSVPHVTYVHLMLPCHEILWANGVETESFHPANTALTTLAAGDRARLLQQFPGLERDPHVYGRFARRNLSGSEAAILRHAA
ncbi:Hint domain-containing protein [Photobacterium sp. TY 1-4]|uniref:Hint domain-containing protein n=2 Tax=Pseudosulfitobacter koreensis TaxID=2968472 RepID=A0ABT1Z2L4_9RHOB|nr:Hint domain-containing protein [Pseudosulfitobacter koreense]